MARLLALAGDLRLATRGLWHAKAFSGAAVLTLAIGIGGACVILALVQGVLLRPLPVRDQGRLIVAWNEIRSSGYAHAPFGDAAIATVAETSQQFEAVAGVTTNGVGRWAAVDERTSGWVNGALVTGRFFEVLGVVPVLGRTLTAEDDVEGAEPVVVISHRLWRGRYGGQTDVVGRRLSLGDQSFVIVGVMPSGLDYPRGVEVWRTTGSVPPGATFAIAARQEVDLVARLRPGVTVTQAASELTGLVTRLQAVAAPNLPRGMLPVVRAFDDVVLGSSRPVLVSLLAAVGLVLLIACANVANLLLLRGETRRQELAVRASLGASRGRLVTHLLAEGLVLALLAGAAGLLVTWWGLEAVVALVPDGLPRLDAVRLDGTVAVFTVVVAGAAAIVASLAPALLTARVELLPQLRLGARGATDRGRAAGRRMLVVAQVALAVAVVAVASLLVRSLLRLQAVDTGLTTERLVFAELSMPALEYADRARHARFLDELQDALRASPEIAAATPVNTSPFSGGWTVPIFSAEGQSEARAAENPALGLEAIHASYFDTLGVTIVRGRAFGESDGVGAPEVAIVSQDVAARVWPGQDPIGQRVKMGAPASRGRWLTVVGIAAPNRYRDLTAAKATLYVPAAQLLVAAQVIALRTAAPIEQVATLVRDRVQATDADVQVMRVSTFAQLLDVPLARPRFNAVLLGVFGAAALLLAMVGQYALMAAYVRQREREFALRVALGATAGDVRTMVLREALALAAVGVGLGLAVALGLTRLLRNLLFEVDTLDPSSLATAVVLLLATSVLASMVPVRRATRADAVAMLRS